MNRTKILAAPVTVIVGQDLAFAEALPKLAPPERAKKVTDRTFSYADRIGLRPAPRDDGILFIIETAELKLSICAIQRKPGSPGVLRKYSVGSLRGGQLLHRWQDCRVLSAFCMIVRVAWDLILWRGLLLRPRESLEAEIPFLRRQLALYRERGAKPRRVDAATRVTLALLSR